jgi:putative addiction module component (TIGR02574 family)
MGLPAKRLMDEVMALPVDQRVVLIEQLLTSLNLPTQPEIDRLWAVEAERRIAEIESGAVEVIPGEQVFAEIKAKYSR